MQHLPPPPMTQLPLLHDACCRLLLHAACLIQLVWLLLLLLHAACLIQLVWLLLLLLHAACFILPLLHGRLRQPCCWRNCCCC
jgi:hypothetical protein